MRADFGWIGLAIAILALSFGLCSLWAGGDEGTKTPRLTLFYVSDVDGNYEPCGCKGNPTGGLSRRSGVIADYRQDHAEPIIQVDLGNLFAQPGPQSAPINDLLAESLLEMPVQAINLTPHDIHYWKELEAPAADRFVSANLRPRRSGLPTPAPFLVVEVPAAESGLGRPLKMAFTGVTDPTQVKPNSGYRGLDPIQALASVKGEALAQADLLVVLADLPRNSSELNAQEPLHRLAQAHPEVAALLNTEGRYVLFPAQMVGETVVASGVERGRQLSRLTFTFDSQGRISEIDHEFYELKDGVPEDFVWRSRQAALKAQLSQ